MKRCAFLSMDDIGDYYVYDELLIEPMASQGWQVETVSWRTEHTDWRRFDAVILRSCWDYQQDPAAFMARLQEIARHTRVFNDLDTVRWNITKSYLRDIESAGIPIVPTYWPSHLNAGVVQQAMSHFNTPELIVKPLISASAEHTYRLHEQQIDACLRDIAPVFSTRPLMLQPFIENVTEEGELSLFYFDGAFSHAIRKVPKHGDFRVQEEHGGALYSINPESRVLELAEKTLKAIPRRLLYARLDFIRYQQDYVVMELELIEPSLYFNMDDDAAMRFVQAFKRMTENSDA
nr:hypothetical protein [Lacimicrobium sp. SS2-24]